MHTLHIYICIYTDTRQTDVISFKKQHIAIASPSSQVVTPQKITRSSHPSRGIQVRAGQLQQDCHVKSSIS